MIQYIEHTNLAYCDGYKFRKDKKSGYWLCTTLHKRLHIYIWEKANGKVPNGYQIHHKDGNKDNNELDNLQLLTRSEHMKLHINEKDKEWLKKNLNEKARPKAIEWHKSEKAKEWHKKHYEEIKNKMHILKEYSCQTCGRKYKSTQVNSKFCSNACKSKWRRKNGVDLIMNNCVICGKEFKTNKYRPSKTCGKKCAGLLNWENRE